MPHIIIEYAQPIANDIDLEALCKSLSEAALATGVFTTPEDVKARAIPATHWYQPVENSTFIHITVRLMAGRTEEQKRKVTTAILEKAAAKLPQVGTISVDIKEIDPATYAKRSV
ncbi:5-carboxymethyl-2-hydroxymuconate Delta-isomerase [Maritalea sp.]|uniref:5-carboxymethyl-2-hydroxymuconate Delta-isomerase n=1 Tax=Maritalea sp. TaxID=2003361 RepID=UPI003EFAE9A7